MKNNYMAGVAASCLLAFMALPASADDTPVAPTCKDGTTSTVIGKGACSHHGGVKKAAAATAGAAPAAAPAAAAAAPAAAASAAAAPAAKTAAPAAMGPAPAGATAKCKDGSYSKSKSHSGACSKHGGVDSWLTT